MPPCPLDSIEKTQSSEIQDNRKQPKISSLQNVLRYLCSVLTIYMVNLQQERLSFDKLVSDIGQMYRYNQLH